MFIEVLLNLPYERYTVISALFLLQLLLAQCVVLLRLFLA